MSVKHLFRASESWCIHSNDFENKKCNGFDHSSPLPQLIDYWKAYSRFLRQVIIDFISNSKSFHVLMQKHSFILMKKNHLVPEFLAGLRPDYFSVGPGPPARAFFTNY